MRICDGDTPMELRSEARENANIILTNPDMLHASVLPYHEYWWVMALCVHRRQLSCVICFHSFLPVGCENVWGSPGRWWFMCQAFQLLPIIVVRRSHFFKKLKYIVIDEAHMYRGVFGSHVAAVLRRLV